MAQGDQPTPVGRNSARQAYLDVIGIAGVGAASYGAWLHYQPLGFIVGGSLLLGLAVVGALRD